MDIIGSGIDATEIARIGDAIDRYGDRFVQRVFTEEEIAYCRRRRDAVSSFAARFAAKEAAMKALGTGHSGGVVWRASRCSGGRPAAARFQGGAAARLRRWRNGIGAPSRITRLAIAHVLLLR